MLFQADALQKHRNSTVSKSDDFSTVEFIGTFLNKEKIVDETGK